MMNLAIIGSFECKSGCSELGEIRGERPPLSVLRSLRDKQVDILREDLRQSWDRYWNGDLEENLNDLVEGHDLRCLADLRDMASLDVTGHNLMLLDGVKKLCKIVATRENQEYQELIRVKRSGQGIEHARRQK